MFTVGKDGSVIENLKEILEKYLKGSSPKYYPSVENLLDLIYEHYTENNSVAPQTTEADKEAKKKEKDLETWLRGMVEAPDHDTCQKYVDEVVRVICEKGYKV